MVAAGQAAILLHLAQHTADHGAQRLLDDLVIGNQAVGASSFIAAKGSAPDERSSGAMDCLALRSPQ
jgi:hypothetical protein